MENASILHEFANNVLHNLFKPLLLFFYMGFLIPILRVPFEFPKVAYQAITIFLLIAIGWHGGEELASLGTHEFMQAGGFMVIGFITNCAIGYIAYLFLRGMTKLRRIDAATIGAYYGSDSAGTFVTCVGVLTGLVLAQKAAQEAGALPAQLSPYENFAYAQYMPVMLAVMEIPGCLVGLAQISRLRRTGMDRWGNMPDEPGYNQPPAAAPAAHGHGHDEGHDGHGHGAHASTVKRVHGEPSGGTATAVADEEELNSPAVATAPQRKSGGLLDPKVLHEVFLNPGLYLLFGGILIGFIGRRQGPSVTAVDDPFFVTMFQGVLCLFLLEMGMTACQRLRDLKTAGVPFILFGIIAPNIFATIGIVVAHLYSHALGEPFTLGTYPLFAVLCGAASYIAVPAVQRMAIPEASPTLPLAASLGLTFSYNVTIGIPLYIEIAKAITKAWPVVEAAAHGA
ncbi:MAG TPA: sodium-dependent bicarbonate transport family permease [Pirellulaceae bacterium]|jgi:hypothetical protein